MRAAFFLRGSLYKIVAVFLVACGGERCLIFVSPGNEVVEDLDDSIGGGVLWLLLPEQRTECFVDDLGVCSKGPSFCFSSGGCSCRMLAKKVSSSKVFDVPSLFVVPPPGVGFRDIAGSKEEWGTAIF